MYSETLQLFAVRFAADIQMTYIAYYSKLKPDIFCTLGIVAKLYELYWLKQLKEKSDIMFCSHVSHCKSEEF